MRNDWALALAPCLTVATLYPVRAEPYVIWERLGVRVPSPGPRAGSVSRQRRGRAKVSGTSKVLVRSTATVADQGSIFEYSYIVDLYRYSVLKLPSPCLPRTWSQDSSISSALLPTSSDLSTITYSWTLRPRFICTATASIIPVHRFD